MKRYLVTSDFCEPFLTDWFDIENNYNEQFNMIVYDLAKQTYYDGTQWHEIQQDHL